jgi:hypothetical protein
VRGGLPHAGISRGKASSRSPTPRTSGSRTCHGSLISAIGSISSAHRLGVNAFFCALAEASRALQGHCLATWRPEHWVRTKAAEVKPDGFGRYLALDLAKDCVTSNREARPDVRKMWNHAFFQSIRVRDGAIADFTYEEPFASLLGSHKGSMVDPVKFHLMLDASYPADVGRAARPHAPSERIRT